VTDAVNDTENSKKMGYFYGFKSNKKIAANAFK
jgi:hypothetical protein